MIEHSQMKIKLFFVTVALFLTEIIQAQQFRAGFTTGLVATGINGMPTRDGRHFHKLGFTAGALVCTKISEKSTFQFELTFIQKGALQRPDSANNGYYKIAFDYVEIPLLIKRQVRFTKRQKPVNRVDLGMGFSVGRMVHNTVVDQTNTLLSKNSSNFNYTDVSLLAEADYNISRNVIFCFRWSNSLVPAVKRTTLNPQFITYTFNRGNNMVLNFSFKFVFGGKKAETAPAKEITSED